MRVYETGEAAMAMRCSVKQVARVSLLAAAGWLMAPVAGAADIPEASLAPYAAPAREPWGAGELGSTNIRETASFDLKEPGSAGYVIVSGEARLPVPNSVLVLPDLKISGNKDRTIASVVIGAGATAKRAEVALAAEQAWTPFTVTRLGERLVCVFGSTAVTGQVGLLSAGRSLGLDLQGGAQARGVKVATLPPAMAVLALDACAPATPEADRAPTDCPRFEPASLPKGLLTVDGVPFLVGERPVDVQYAQKGADFSRRLKFFTVSQPGPGRPVGFAAGRSYTWLHVLAYSREMPGTVPRMTLSYGDGVSWAGLMEEEVVDVPDFGKGGESPYVVSRVPVKVAGGKKGWLYHLRIPVARSANYWFRPNTSFEFSRAKQDLHNLPDPNEFARVPVGLPSSVVVVSATAEQAPVEFSYVLTEPGNVFHETSPVVLKISLTNRLAGRFEGRVVARSAGPGTGEELNVQRSEWSVEQKVALEKGQARELAITVMPNDRKKRGWFSLEIAVEAGGVPVQVYRTTYAVLAPDTRKAMADSPFGVWEFWGVHTMYGQGKRHCWDIASLISKGGWRWTYGGDARERGQVEGPTAEQLFDQFKLTYTIRNTMNCYQRGTGWWDQVEFDKTVAPGIRTNALLKPKGVDRVYKVLHESRSSDTLLRRYGELLGGEPYAMPDKEKVQIDQQFANVVSFCRAIKKTDPDAKICLINDYPGVGAEYMKRGMPKDAFDYFGSEMANFMREPERQPDWLCLLGLTHQWKRAQEKYGYTDKPVWTTEALYHATNPGNLSLHKQAVIQNREAMLALANGVERMCAAGCIRDVTDDYRWSNWGSSGFCFREPEINPKPNYAMYAWLTQVLDQARYAGKVAPDSTSLHILDFKKPDGSHVYPVWCVRGSQDVSLSVTGGKAVVFDAYGNALPVQAKDGRLALPVCDTPLYVTGVTVDGVAARKPVEAMKGDDGAPLFEFDDGTPFKMVAGQSKILESSWDYPRLKGDYAVEFVQEDGATAMKLSLKDDAEPRKLLQRYVEIELAKPVVFKEPVAAFTARVKGNGGWGRLMFELVDADGRLWTSCGNQYAGSCNASDNRGESYVSFDGWRTMTIEAPGRYPATDLVAYRSSTCTWWPENTPEWRQIQADYRKAVEVYEAAMKEYPAQKKAYDEVFLAHNSKVGDYNRAKAAYAKEQADYAAAMKVYTKSRGDYDRAKTAYDKAVKEGKSVIAPAAPAVPQAPVLQAPTAPGEAPKALKEPPAPGQLRNYGISPVAYPVKLTKIIFASSPNMLYVADEVPVTNRAVFIDRIGVMAGTAE
jgi:hypothetical protein